MDLEAVSLTPLAGGWSGRTFLAEAADGRSVVRIYPPRGPRCPSAPEIDAAVLRLVRGLVPVAEVLEVRRGDPGQDRPGLLVTALLPGERGDLVLAGLGVQARAALGHRLGDLLADLAGMPVLRTGPFLDAELRIGDFGVDGLPAWVDQHAADLRAAWSPALLDGLRRVSAVAQDLLDQVARSCVVHSDLNPKNLLLDPASLALTGVVDWEFCHGGHPFTDLGNLLRFEREPGFTEAVVSSYVDRRGGTGAEAVDLARAADLWALVDLAARAAAGRGNPVAARADRLLRAIAEAQELHAQPEA